MRYVAVCALICLGLFGLVTTGCPAGRTPAQFPEHLMANFTADNAGALFPCGCRIPMGGLSRRAGVLAQDSPYPQLTVDAGSFSGGNTGYDIFAAGFIIKAYLLMGYHAINLGRRESVQKVSTIRDWDSLSAGSLISANLVDGSGLPVTRTHLIREIGGIKIGITGMTAQGFTPVDATEMPNLIPPVPPLQAVIEEFKAERVDYFVLLADAGTPELEAIVAEIPDFDLIVQGQEFNPNQGLLMLELGEKTRLVRIGGNGKYLGRVRLDFNTDGTPVGQEFFKVDLDSTVPTLSAISELMVEFKIDLRDHREEFLGDPANPFQRSQAPELIDVLEGYTGEAFCTSCHPGYNMDQQVAGHTLAWNTLGQNDQANPECLTCHTTGYGVPTGMSNIDRDTHLKGVTCEACHGPAAGHVREMTALREELDPAYMIPPVDETGIPFTADVPEELCLRCHTEEWSPDFDYDNWIPRVNHKVARDRAARATSGEAEPSSPVLPPENTPEGDN